MHKKKRGREKKRHSKRENGAEKDPVVSHPVVRLPKDVMDSLVAQYFPALRRCACYLVGYVERIQQGRNINLTAGDLTMITIEKILRSGVIREGWDFLPYARSKMRQYLFSMIRTDKRHGYLAIEHRDKLEVLCDETERSLRNPWVSGDHEPDRECSETEENGEEFEED